MKRYLFYPAADAAQDAIWRYTHEQWGEAQADRYVTELHVHLTALAAGDIPRRPLLPHLLRFSGMVGRVYITRYAKHVIFFREFTNGDIGVMSILHEAMDLPVRLREDLRRLEEKE